MPDWRFAKTKTLMVAALFLALPGSPVVGSGDGSDWSYIEDQTPQGTSFYAARMAVQRSGPRATLRFSFKTQAQCESTVGLGYFIRAGSGYGKLTSTATAPEEWAVQVDDHSPEQGRASVLTYSNSWEIVLPVSQSLVNDAKSGRLLRMWQTGVGKYAPPPERRTHTEFFLDGAASPLERAEARCAEATGR